MANLLQIQTESNIFLLRPASLVEGTGQESFREQSIHIHTLHKALLFPF